MSTYKEKKEDLIDDLASFPIEIVQAMIDEQVRQGNKANVSVFQICCSADKDHKGFDWKDSKDGVMFWGRILLLRDFSLFFEKYPPQLKEVTIQIPEGYEIDKENSTFEKIIFKPLKDME